MNKSIYLFFISFIFFNFLFLHENIHKQIASYHGCVDSDIKYGLVESYFVCNEYIDQTQENKKQEMLLHSINEIAGYYLQIVFAMFALFGWIVNNYFIKRLDIK